MPFETFSKEEVERLVEQVLTAKAQGVSVRACVQQLAGGDRTRMLRYQNKYRSTVRTRPELVRGVMERLNEQGRRLRQSLRRRRKPGRADAAQNARTGERRRAYRSAV